MANLTLPLPINSGPSAGMVALVVVQEILALSLDRERSLSSISWLFGSVPVKNVVDSRDEPVFVPLSAAAFLPFLATSVAKLRTALTG